MSQSFAWCGTTLFQEMFARFHNISQNEDDGGNLCNFCYCPATPNECSAQTKYGSSLLQRKTPLPQKTKEVLIVASTDTGWQKRGNGKSQNSLRVVAQMFGSLTGKVIAFSAWQKQCRVCSVAARRKSFKKRSCRKTGQSWQRQWKLIFVWKT